jgi:hypothetical protein
VCEGRVPLAEAQRAIARNWTPLTGNMQRRRREAPHPTGIVTVTAFVAVSMTDTMPESMFAT